MRRIGMHYGQWSTSQSRSISLKMCVNILICSEFSKLVHRWKNWRMSFTGEGRSVPAITGNDGWPEKWLFTFLKIGSRTKYFFRSSTQWAPGTWYWSVYHFLAFQKASSRILHVVFDIWKLLPRQFNNQFDQTSCTNTECVREDDQKSKSR